MFLKMTQVNPPVNVRESKFSVKALVILNSVTIYTILYSTLLYMKTLLTLFDDPLACLIKHFLRSEKPPKKLLLSFFQFHGSSVC